MQKVEIYYEMFKAYIDMKKHIDEGWRVHTCTMGAYIAGYTPSEKVIVVYERE